MRTPHGFANKHASEEKRTRDQTDRTKTHTISDARNILHVQSGATMHDATKTEFKTAVHKHGANDGSKNRDLIGVQSGANC